MHVTSQHDEAAHHFTLTHSPRVMSVSAIKWTLLVAASNASNMITKNAKETSTINRKVGCNADPGVKMLARKDASSGSAREIASLESTSWRTPVMTGFLIVPVRFQPSEKQPLMDRVRHVAARRGAHHVSVFFFESRAAISSPCRCIW
jgi:hypothetical protein